MKILIAEDTEDSRIMLEMALLGEGYEVISTVNGKQALNTARNNTPDLIISDIMMPEMDGFELCREVKKDNELKSIPFIFYTATYIEHQDEELGLALGASRFLVKPIEPQALMAIIHDELNLLQNGKSVIHGLQKNESELDDMHIHSVRHKLDQKNVALAQEQRALELSEEKYRHLVESVQDYYFFYTHNTEGVFTYVSPSVERVLGYKPEEFLEHYSEYLTTNPVNKDVERYSQLSIKGEEQSPYEVETHNKNGSISWLEVKETPVFDSDNKVIHVEGIAHDITERKQAEGIISQDQKMSALGKLTGGIAHDYNNTLAVILGYAELIDSLQDSFSSTPELALKLDEYTHEIIHAAERGARLSKKLLSFSRQKSSEKKVLDIKAVLISQKNMIEKMLTPRINLGLSLEDDLWPVKLDASELEDTVINLSINAMHAIESVGQLIIQARNKNLQESETRELDLPAGDYVLLEFKDTGCGIDKEIIAKIFDPFYSTKGEKGSGLGLSQVYGFMKRSNGTIKADSAPGQGAHFSLYFPRSMEKIVEDTRAVTERPVAISSDKKILVVDDEPVLLRLTSEILRQDGYGVFIAQGGKQALEILAKENIDLLISDVLMPEMDGYELAGRVQEKYPSIKIQMLSGFSDDLHHKLTDKMIYQNLLEKPVNAQKLLKRVRELLA